MTRPPPLPPPPGAQAERTALAWRRTALGVGAGAVVVGRLAAPAEGVAAYVLVAIGGVGAAALTWVATRRYRSARRALDVVPGEAAVPGAGLATALLATVAALTGGLAAWYVLTGGGG